MANFFGTPGNDTLIGTNDDDALFGLDGNDTLDGRFGFDRIDGGEGNDTTTYDFFSGSINANLETGVVSFPGNSDRTDTLVSIENIVGAQGNDVIVGNSLNNVISGGNGDDSLFGGAGDDVLDGGFGFDRIDGGEGNDTTTYDFFAGSINANLETGVVSFPGNSDRTDTLVSIENVIGAQGNDVIVGNSLNNVISGGNGDDSLFGGAGDDVIDGGFGFDRIDGGEGNDTTTYDFFSGSINANLEIGVVSFPGNSDRTDTLVSIENVIGAQGNDVIVGNSLNNVIFGGAGDDVLDGGFGFDRIDGGEGNDTTTYDFFSGGINANLETGVVSFPGNSDLTDTLVSIENVIGSRGNDTLIGNEQDNILDGNLGDDILNGNLGNDTLRGGAGNDFYIVQDAGDQVIENANEGVDVIVSSVSYTLPANVEHLVLSGSANINATGNELNNILVGNSGVNTLTGNSGDDILVGLRGADVLSGGAGADKFGFTAPTDGVDRIQDFSRREGDQIVLLTDGFPGLRSGILRGNQFVLGNRAKDRNDRLIYNRRNGGLFYDADGRGGAAQVRIATLGNRAALRASDILAVSTNDLSLPFSLGVGSGLPLPVSPAQV